jgi:hypothetical protein
MSNESFDGAESNPHISRGKIEIKDDNPDIPLGTIEKVKFLLSQQALQSKNLKHVVPAGTLDLDKTFGKNGIFNTLTSQVYRLTVPEYGPLKRTFIYLKTAASNNFFVENSVAIRFEAALLRFLNSQNIDGISHLLSYDNGSIKTSGSESSRMPSVLLADGGKYSFGDREVNGFFDLKNTQNLTNVKNAFGPIALALDEINGRGVIYTDLRPSNCRIDMLIQTTGNIFKKSTKVVGISKSSLTDFSAGYVYFGTQPSSELVDIFENLREENQKDLMIFAITEGMAPVPEENYLNSLTPEDRLRVWKIYQYNSFATLLTMQTLDFMPYFDSQVTLFERRSGLNNAYKSVRKTIANPIPEVELTPLDGQVPDNLKLKLGSFIERACGQKATDYFSSMQDMLNDYLAIFNSTY